MKNDKKKTIVFVGLAVVLLAVGAFQFIPKDKPVKATVVDATSGSGGTSPDGQQADGKKPELGPDGKKLDPQKELLRAMVSAPLARRDPFAQETVPPTASTNNPPTQPQIDQPKVARMGSSGGGSMPKMGGTVPPYEPLPQGGGIGANPNEQGLTKAAPLRQPGEFAYKVRGVLNGPKPMAVFEDDSGNQRLVPLGGSVDGDSKVVGIERGKVHIRHKGKDKTLTLTEGQ